MALTISAAKLTDLRSLPRIDTHVVGLDNFLNPNAYLNGFGFEGSSGRGALAQILNEQLDYKSLLDYTELTGRVSSINSLEYFNYESGLMQRSVKIATLVAGSTPGLVQFTLDPDSYSSTGSINGTVDRSPLRVNDLFMTKNMLTGIVIGKSGSGTSTVYTAIRRDNVGDDLQAALDSHRTTGIRLMTYSTAFSEGSRSPDEGMFQSTIRLMGQMQTFRSIDKLTGDIDAIPLVIGDQKYLIDKTALKQEMRHRMEVNNAMWLSPGGNFTIPGNGAGTGRARLTTGLIPGVMQLGSTFTHDANAGYSAADIDALDAMNIASYAGDSFTVFEGPGHASAFGKGIKAQLGSAGANVINWTAFGPNSSAEKKAVELGFRSITTEAGLTYHRQQSNFFNIPEMTAVTGYPFKDMAIFIPGGQQTISVENNGVKEKVQVPSLEILHTTASDGEKRRYYTFRRNITIDGIDEKKIDTITQQGIRVVNLRNYTLGVAA